jgi:predicted RNA-binding protein YlqC (UPF0109 family)
MPQDVQAQSADPSAVELIDTIARSLVDQPASVSVRSESRGDGTVLYLHVDPSDVGKVIGKQGRTARSLRTILSAVSVKLHHRYGLEIVEEDKAGNGAAHTA